MAGLINDSRGLAYYGTTDLSAKKGYIVKKVLDTTIKVSIAGASDFPDGYVEVGKNTTLPSTINAFRPGERVGLVCGDTHAAIALADEVCLAADGEVIKLPTSTGTYEVIGKAESALASNTVGGVIVCVNRRTVTVA